MVARVTYSIGTVPQCDVKAVLKMSSRRDTPSPTVSVSSILGGDMMDSEGIEIDIADQVPSSASEPSDPPHPANETSTPGTSSLKPFCLTPFNLLSLLVPSTFGISKTVLAIGGLSLVPNALDIALSLLAASLYFITLFEETTNSSFIHWLFEYNTWALIKHGSVIFELLAPWDSHIILLTVMLVSSTKILHTCVRRTIDSYLIRLEHAVLVYIINDGRKNDNYQTSFVRVVQGHLRKELAHWYIPGVLILCITITAAAIYSRIQYRMQKLWRVMLWLLLGS
ncbi:hypothetical protein DL93DRAFT_1672317 [Clavulina sp. PMI_390]|nr:hypothetical protein DL93DRAFT_1672317 [Clavulina sp. PMI_390]